MVREKSRTLEDICIKGVGQLLSESCTRILMD